MHPQAIIVDASDAEERYFLDTTRDQVRATRSALIELPARSGNRLSWITKLDATALSGLSTHDSLNWFITDEIPSVE